MGVQDITNEGNGTEQAETDVLKSTIKFGLNLIKEITTLSSSKQENKNNNKKKEIKPVKHTLDSF